VGVDRLSGRLEVAGEGLSGRGGGLPGGLPGVIG
jgi:hypothetical protein